MCCATASSCGPEAAAEAGGVQAGLAINPDNILARYAANRLRVVRQVRYSTTNSLDLVLFLNGLPVATAELKTDFTQGIDDAWTSIASIACRVPRDSPPRPLLSFPNGALVHFAVSNQRGPHGDQARRPAPVPAVQPGRQVPRAIRSTHRAVTACLSWEQVWARASWLEIIGRYLVAQARRTEEAA